MATIDEITNPKGKKVFRVRVRMKVYPAQTATFDRKADARIWAQQTEMAIREGKHFKFLQAIAEVLGHKTLQMVKRYAHLSEAHTSKVVASMNEKLFSTKMNQGSNIVSFDVKK